MQKTTYTRLTPTVSGYTPKGSGAVEPEGAASVSVPAPGAEQDATATAGEGAAPSPVQGEPHSSFVETAAGAISRLKSRLSHAEGYTPPEQPPLPDIVNRLITYACCGYLFLSGPLLNQYGYAYEGDGGNPATKIHPCSYMAIYAFVKAHRSATGGFSKNFAQSFKKNKLISVYFLCVTYMLFYFAVVHGPKALSTFIETLIVTALIAYTLLLTSDEVRAKIYKYLLMLMVFNNFIGVLEGAGKFHFVKFTVSGVETVEFIFRSTAFLGQPLVAAALSALALLLVIELRMPSWQRLGCIMIIILGLLSFGGRTSMMLSIVALTIYSTLQMGIGLMKARFTFTQITGSLLAALLVLGGMAGMVVGGGLGERIFNKMEVDDSAKVRVLIWRIPGVMDTNQTLVGITAQELTSLQMRVGLSGDIIIENFWLAYYLMLGVYGFVPFVLGFLSIVIYMWLISGGLGRMSLIVFFMVASSNNSLATKNTQLKMFLSFSICGASYRRHMARLDREALLQQEQEALEDEARQALAYSEATGEAAGTSRRAEFLLRDLHVVRTEAWTARPTLAHSPALRPPPTLEPPAEEKA